MTDGTAQGGSQAQENFEPLTLRARPRPVTRFNRRVIIGASALVCVVIVIATLIALQPIRFREPGDGEELFNTEHKTTAEGLDTLPRTYGDFKPPELGPPLQGDIGPPVVQLEQELGVTNNTGFRPDAEADAERAERLRLARQAQQAREAGVFFQVSAVREAPMSAVAARAATGSSNNVTLTPNNTSLIALDRARDPSPQGRKVDFLEGRPPSDTTNPHPLVQPQSPDTVFAGTVISASLVTGINSDLPGFVIAQVTENVFDTVTGERLLIPQGTKLIGKYDSVVAFGQRRALVVWNRLIMPNGSSIVIDNLPATDAAGYAGLEDEVEFHTWQLVKGVALSTLLGVGTQLTLGGEESDLVRALREATQQNASRAGQQLTERNLDIQPTITIRPGWPLRVVVHKDLILRTYRE